MKCNCSKIKLYNILELEELNCKDIHFPVQHIRGLEVLTPI